MATAPQHYCLQWNNYQAHVIELFVQLLEENCLVDVTLSVEGKSIHCHRIILSACSCFFQDIFANVDETHPIVILGDMKFIDVKSVIEFMYRGELSVSADQVASVLQVARELKVRGLMEVSNHILDIDNDTSTSPASLEDAHMMEVPSIENMLNQDLEEFEEDEPCSDTVDYLINADSDSFQLDSEKMAIIDRSEDIKKKCRRDRKKNYNEVVMKEALEDLRSGRSLLETSMSRHIPRSTLYFRARAQGVPLTITRQEHSHEKIVAALQAVTGGASLQQAAQQYKIPKTVLWRRLQKEGNQYASIKQNKARPVCNAEKRLAAIKALESGENLSKVSDQFQIPKTTLFREKSRLVEAGRLPWSCLRKRDQSSEGFKQRRLAEAVAACKEGKMSQATASITYRVPKTTIWRRIQQGMKSDIEDCTLNHQGDLVEQQIEVIETEEIQGSEIDLEYSSIAEDNTQMPITYIDDADFSDTSLIILTSNGDADESTITMQEHQNQDHC